jgi:hypothetical protein
MKRLLAILIICGLLVLPAMAMIIQEPTTKDDGSGKEILPIETILPAKETNPTIEPIVPEKTILSNRELFKKTIIQYSERTTLLKKITLVFDKLIGLTPVEETTEVLTVDVVVDDQTVASIQPDSKFNGIEPHSYCLEYQYGTTNWYNCEQELL